MSMNHTKNKFGPAPVSFDINGFAELSMLTYTPLPYDDDYITGWDKEYETAVFQTIVNNIYSFIMEKMSDYSETYEGYVEDEECEDDERWIDHKVTLKNFDIEVSSKNNGYYGAIYEVSVEMVNGWDETDDGEDVWNISDNEVVHEFADALEAMLNNNIDHIGEICAEASMEHSDLCEYDEELLEETAYV